MRREQGRAGSQCLTSFFIYQQRRRRRRRRPRRCNGVCCVPLRDFLLIVTLTSLLLAWASVLSLFIRALSSFTLHVCVCVLFVRQVFQHPLLLPRNDDDWEKERRSCALSEQVLPAIFFDSTGMRWPSSSSSHRSSLSLFLLCCFRRHRSSVESSKSTQHVSFLYLSLIYFLK